MDKTDLELVEKQSAAKGWLQRIATEGILEFDGTNKYLQSDIPLPLGLSDFTLLFIYTPYDLNTTNQVIFKTRLSTTADNRMALVYDSSNSAFRLNFGDSSSTIINISYTTDKLIEDNTYIVFLSFSRDGYCDLFEFNLDEPSSIFGFVDRVDISSTSDIDIGLGVTDDAYFFENSSFPPSGQAWLYPIVNRAMTSEEIHAYVMGIGSPNSLPEDLRGVGNLDGSTSTSAFNYDGIYGYDSFTNATLTGFDASVTDNGQGYAFAGFTLDEPWLDGEVMLIEVTHSGDVARFRASTSENLSGTAFYMDALDNESRVVYVKNESGLTAKAIAFRVDSVNYPATFSISDFKIRKVGQIFDIRPHRSGTHTDDTGNGYNWTNVGSPVIKPFSAGIR